MSAASKIVQVDDLVKRYMGADGDVKTVAQWFDCAVEDLSLFEYDAPAADFAEHVQYLVASYRYSPEDAARTMQFASSIKPEGPHPPIFLDANGCVLKGHHRLVAYYLAGVPTIPTVCVRSALLEHESASTMIL